MARPKTPPGKRYTDVVPIWNLVMISGRRVTYQCPTRSKGINILHRLHQYRKEIRELEPDGVTDMDLYVVRLDDREISIEPRHQIDFSQLRTDTGESYEEVMRRSEVTMPPRTSRYVLDKTMQELQEKFGYQFTPDGVIAPKQRNDVPAPPKEKRPSFKFETTPDITTITDVDLVPQPLKDTDDR